jgi:AraC family transcriptional regulator of adaptative response / DNA-3-methyladenine glycosylase II
MRALGDPDAFPSTDLGVRRAVSRLGYTGDPAAVAERWRPWRAYATQHLWASLGDVSGVQKPTRREVVA